jgi:hypothetical protein
MGYRTWDFDYFQWMSHQMQVLLHAKDEFLNPVAAAGDVVGVIDFRSSWYRARYLGNCNLIGLDARTGAPRWITEEVGGFSGTTPLAWTPDGTPDSARLVIGDGREIRCVRPVDGNVVWSVPGGTTTGSTLTRDRLITCRPGGKSLVSYAIGPDEATALDRAGGDEAQVDVSDGSPPAVTDNGLLYTRYSWEEQVVNKDGERVKVTRAGVAVFDIKKGAIVKKSASPIRPADILCAGKQALLMSGGAACVWKSASDRPPRRPFTLPRDRRTSPALAGGRLYLRTRNRIVSYELRERYTRLDADEMKACIAVLKTGTPSRGAEAGLALGNTAADLIPVALANLRDYVKVESGNAFLEGSSAAKKRVRVKDYGRVIAAAEAMARLAAREEAPQAERDATARALGALLEVGTSAQRAEICKAIGAMGGAGKAALPALQDAFANDAVREALREAARSIMEDPDYELTIRVRLPGTGDVGGDGLDLDMGL